MAEVEENVLREYDSYYDTLTSSDYRPSLVGLLGGILIIFTGIVLASLTLADLDRGLYNQNKGTSATNTLVWTENPFWPTYGKGLWVGLFMISIGVLGLFAHCEETVTAIKVFGVGALLTALLSFYLLISTIKEIRWLEELTKVDALSQGQYNTYALNSAMAAFGSLGVLLGLVAGIFSLAQGDYFSDSSYEPLKQGNSF